MGNYILDSVATRLLQGWVDNPNRCRYIHVSVGVGAGRATKDKNMNQTTTPPPPHRSPTPAPTVVVVDSGVTLSACCGAYTSCDQNGEEYCKACFGNPQP